MAKVKFKQVFETIWNTHKELFQKFFILNNEYSNAQNRQKLEEEFQEIGKQVKDLLVKGEDELCGQMEKSNHRIFSSKLADKYWDEVRKYFKFIDQVGVITKRK
jgi:hypothetical protein